LKTLILCGGRGTRAYPHTVELPKPLLTVGEHPVLLHVMRIYAEQGFTEFVLSAGFKSELVVEFANSLPSEWDVDVIDTGEEANTGERIERCRDVLGDRFFATYGDGLGDVDLQALLAFHEGHDGSATVTVVPLPSQYGTIETDAAGHVKRFLEKPRLTDHRINAGFFAFDATVFERWQGADLEREVLPKLGDAGVLYAFRHDGFWRSMDTYKDSLELTRILAEETQPPWLR
jgi:glucose-1-phosphate cytidylyltransferase